jgi:hypothetical protein
MQKNHYPRREKITPKRQRFTINSVGLDWKKRRDSHHRNSVDSTREKPEFKL